MQESAENAEVHRPPKHVYQRRWFKITAVITVVGVIGLFAVLEYVVHHAAPILRKRVIQTLSERFNAPVELDSLDISLVEGVEVSGYGLRIPFSGLESPVSSPSGPRELISIEHFSFRSTIVGLLHTPTRVGAVLVDNVVVDLPAGSDRRKLLGTKEHAVPADPTNPKTVPKVALLVDEILCHNVKLILEVSDPRKEPHVFDIERLALDKNGDNLSYDYHAKLTNPVPRGMIEANGHAGPWNQENPRQTPISGDYSFQNADMNTIKGIGGTLNSTGHFDGVLELLTVDGTADVPNFSLDISDHPMALHTKFHAYVNGTTGDTTLDPVEATLGRSSFLCKGTVMNLRGKGHDIALGVLMPHGQIDDLLYLGMKSQPPVMRGGVWMKTKLHIPPGKVRVAEKIELAGNLKLDNATFTNARIQNRLDGFSMRAQGRPRDVAGVSNDKKAEAHSELQTTFDLSHGQMTFSKVDYTMPGVALVLDGVYAMEASAFEFKGHIRTDAKPSQMVTGWRSWLLKPADPFLAKHGAGLELPISITGRKNDVHFGLAFKDADDTPQQMREDLQQKVSHGSLAKPKKAEKENKATPQP